MLYTKKEFAALCGMPTNKLSVYISRGKVVLSDGKLIDDEKPANRDFLLRNNHEPTAVEHPKAEKAPEKKEKPQRKSAASGDKYALEVEKLEKTNKKLDVETRLAELKEEKIRGEVVPILLVSNIFKSHTQSIVTSQKDFIENLLVNITKEYRLTGDQLARLRGKMVDGLNAAVDKSITASKRNLKALVEEFSIKKEVGEHE